MASTQITEKFEFLTDIISSYEGQEQRIKLRSIPRHYLSYDYSSMDSFQAQWLRGLLRSKQTDVTHIPMWHNPIHINTNVVAGSKVLYVDDEYMLSLNRCDAILIFKEDSYRQGNIVRVVERYESGIIGLKVGINVNLDKRNTYVFPLIRCSVQPTSGLNYVYSNGTEVTVNFEDILFTPTFNIPSNHLFNIDEDYLGRNEYNLPTKIGGRDVLLITPQWVEDDSVSMSIDKNTNKLDNTTGIFAYDLKNKNYYDTISMNVYLSSKKEINNFIRFFHRVGGRYKYFYVPTWVNDFNPCFDITAGKNYIYTDFDQLYKYYISSTRKKKIVIFTNDYKSYIYDILTYSTEILADQKRYGKLILTSPITTSVPKNNISMLSYLNKVRLDSDTLQLDYESNIVAGTTIVMKEVDDI